jgi:hypothetical protein
LVYLEEKKIINSSKLENDDAEINSLLKDIMKLDLAKFTKSNGGGGMLGRSPVTSKAPAAVSSN